jgi:hypothetical protein
MRGISRLTENWLGSEEGMCFVKWVSVVRDQTVNYLQRNVCICLENDTNIYTIRYVGSVGGKQSCMNAMHIKAVGTCEYYTEIQCFSYNSWCLLIVHEVLDSV